MAAGAGAAGFAVTPGISGVLTECADAQTVEASPATIATTSNTDVLVSAPCDGVLESADFASVSALTANDTNYVTFSITNLGQAGSGSTAMLAATDTNTTKATGGTGLTANSRRSLSLSATAGNTKVNKGDVLRVRYAASGTLAGAVSGATTLLRFVPNAI